jgi:hypothetical protein
MMKLNLHYFFANLSFKFVFLECFHYCYAYNYLNYFKFHSLDIVILNFTFDLIIFFTLQ